MAGAAARPAGVRPAPWPLLGAVILSASAYATMQGLSYPLLALLLEQGGAAGWEIGVNAAMTPLGMVAAGALAGRLVGRLGPYRLALAAFAVASLCLLSIRALEPPWPWLVPRFGLGLAVACIFVVTDTWTNQLAPDRVRGRVLGLYAALLSLGFAIGPAILAAVGTAGWAPFLAGAACALAALVPLLVVRRALPGAPREPHVSLRAFLPAAPLLLVAVGVVAFVEQAILSLLPVWAGDEGIPTRLAPIMLVVLVAGSVSLMLPLGWLADRVPRPRLMVACAAASAACAGLLPLAGEARALLWPLLFAWGGVYYAIYALSLVLLGERFRGQLLVAGTAAFGAVWGVAGTLGPPVVGGAMDLLGAAGLPVGTASLFAALALLVAAQARRIGPRSSESPECAGSPSAGSSDRSR